MIDSFINKYLNGGEKGRRAIVVPLGLIGACLNILLFALKYTAGIISGSVAITADAFNNLADIGSCALALLGIYLGNKGVSKNFPNGKGRLEYLSGLFISIAILAIGGNMLISSVIKILRPEKVEAGKLVMILLIASIAVKGCLYFFFNKIGRALRSAGMRAAALDSLADCIGTVAIIISLAIERYTGFHADGWTGVAVAFCILYAGYTSAKESLCPLIGGGIEPEVLSTLNSIVSHDNRITALERAQVHDYGPEKKLLTCYIRCECPEKVIPELRERIAGELHMEAVICPGGYFGETENNSFKSSQE